MSTTTQSVFATLDVLAWRDEQMAAISAQLEDAFPGLRASLDRLVDEGSLLSVAAATPRLSPGAGSIIRAWSEEQGRIAVARAAAELENLLSSRPPDLDAGSVGWGAVAATADVFRSLGHDVAATALPAVAGVGLLAASLAAIPTVASFATVTTSTFAFFATSTVSWPLVAVGALVIATTTYLCSTALKQATDKTRASLKRRMGETAARRVRDGPQVRCKMPPE